MTGPDPLLEKFAYLIEQSKAEGPVLDLACGDGHNGLYLAERGLSVILADLSRKALEEAKQKAQAKGLFVRLWEVDLERGGNPLEEDAYRAVLVFRYLHRPLFPFIKKGIRKGGILIYETYTDEKIGEGPPRNPDHLLHPGELAAWFKDWRIIHYAEGIGDDPGRTTARLVCEKP
jgi:tellurite methyltransferase